jgi:hypothetical protein
VPAAYTLKHLLLLLLLVVVVVECMALQRPPKAYRAAAACLAGCW